MLKVGLVTGEFPPLQGGVGAFTQELAKALAELGHEVHVLTSRLARPVKEGQRQISDLFEPVSLEFAQLHPFARRWYWRDIVRVADIAVRYELDILNIQYQAAAYHMRYPAINFAPHRWQGIAPTIVTFHDLRVPYLFPKAGNLRHWIINTMANSAQGAIVTNPEDHQTLATRVSTSICEIPIGSNITTHTPPTTITQQLRTGLGVPANGHLLGYFGFLHPSKGADLLLDALQQGDDQTHLVFIGGQTGNSDTATTQPFWTEIQRKIETQGLQKRVHWSGFLPDEQVSTYLSAVDMMVMPYQDGVSLRRGTLMAILAHGCPLITTEPLVPTPALAHGQNCWLVPANSITPLVQAIEHLKANAGIRAQLGQGAKQVAQQFTWDKIAQQTVAFYEQLLAEQPPKNRYY